MLDENLQCKPNLRSNLVYLPVLLAFFTMPIPSQEYMAAVQGAAANAKLPIYDVASIRPHKESDNGSSWHAPTADGYSARNVRIFQLILTAYDLKSPSQLIGLPKWAYEESFDIEAKMENDAVAPFQKLSNRQQWEQAALMLRPLLADRFKLAVRRETKNLPVYALVIAKSGFKLHPSKAPESLGGMLTNRGMIAIHGGPVGARFVAGLSDVVGRIVVDKTGLAGNYDFTLKWTPEGSQANDPNAPPDLFTAIEEQLGLKLISTRAPIEIVVVEHIERPSAN